MYPQKIASELVEIETFYEYSKEYLVRKAMINMTYLFAERFDIPKTVRREVLNWITGRNTDTAMTFAKYLLDRYYSEYTPLKGYE